MIAQDVDQFEGAESIKPGVHLPCKLVQILAVPETLVKRLSCSDLLQASQ